MNANRTPRVRLATVALALLAAASAWAAPQATDREGPSVVRVVRDGDSWSLVRNGEPYFVKGAGGQSNLERLVAAGGNSIRTWSTDNAREILDRAHAQGVTVMLGYWVQHPRHGFDYSDRQAVEAQRRSVREAVEEFKDHPALLMWAVGNEVELASDPDLVFPEINHLARMIKEIDPNHPTMAVLAGTGERKVERFVALCPDVDLLGINAYGEAPRVPELITEQGYTGPFLVTEFGPTGHWEIATSPWGVPIEPTSSEKAASYEATYRRAVLGHPDRCLGSYVFLWGQKQEVTATWYGMFLPTGESTETLDAMHRVWSGEEPEQKAPSISRIRGPLALETVKPDRVLWAEVDANDPDGDELTYEWKVVGESTDRRIGGDPEAAPDAFPALTLSQGPRAEIRTPSEPGRYRLFVKVTDGTGRAATANVPFLVE